MMTLIEGGYNEDEYRDHTTRKTQQELDCFCTLNCVSIHSVFEAKHPNQRPHCLAVNNLTALPRNNIPSCGGVSDKSICDIDTSINMFITSQNCQHDDILLIFITSLVENYSPVK